MKRRALGVALAFGLLGLAGGDLRAAPISAGPPPAGAAEDIRDIHGPITAPVRGPYWPYLAGTGVVAAIVAGLVLRTRRRPRPRTPAQRALEALAETRSLASVDSRRFAFALSEIVRRYVEDRFALPAAHRTTEELLGGLMRDESPVAAHRPALGEFLQCCDLAKFAGWSLSSAQLASMQASAEAFVRATSGVATEAIAASSPQGASQGTPS
jgi:hypothetical protein